MSEFPFPVDVAELGPHFTKYNLHMPGKASIHHMRGPDIWPHDHDKTMISLIMAGGYVEVVYNREGKPREEINRLRGHSFRILRNRIHRIAEHIEGETWTLTLPFGEIRDDWHVYDFANKLKRLRNEGEWVPL